MRTAAQTGEGNTMKNVCKVAATLASLALAACGGGGGNAALSKTFTYGAPQAPSTAEQTAASSAQTTVTSSGNFGTAPDATTAASIVSLADDLASSAMGGTVAAAGITPDPRLTHALRSAAALDTCTTVTSTPTSASVTFNNCADSSTGYTFMLNGSITANNDGVTTTVKWDVQGSFSGTQNGVTLNLNLSESGTLTVTSSTVKGDALASLSGNVSAGGQNASFRVDECAAADVSYIPSCMSSGSIEVKRVWAERPNGSTSTDLPDVGVKLVWTGSAGSCGQVNVQHST
jgi:hypothetical protein